MDNKPINLWSFVMTRFMGKHWYRICQCKKLNQLINNNNNNNNNNNKIIIIIIIIIIKTWFLSKITIIKLEIYK